jgi:hypothetical protein
MEQKENDSADIRIPPPIFFFISLAFGIKQPQSKPYEF